MAPAHLAPSDRRASWNDPDGHERLQQAVLARVPYVPDEWQIRVPGLVLSGVDVLLVLKTGGGKTSLVTHAVYADPDSITLMVSPLNALEVNQAERFVRDGIRAVAINAETLREANATGRDLWAEARQGKFQIVLTSPEQLKTRAADRVLENETFRNLVARFVVDECHVILQWSDSLRPAYSFLSDMREKLPEHVVFVAMTATLPPGRPTRTVLQTLGFRPGQYHVERGDCERTDIDLFVRELQNGIDKAFTFPDLDWLVPETIAAAGDVPKTLIYCDSIDLGDRVARYLRSLLPARLRAKGTILIRTVSSLSCPLCKADALRTLAESGEERTCAIHAATDVISMGVDISDIERVICFGTPESLVIMLQRIGRLARTRGIRGSAYIYIRMSDFRWARQEAERQRCLPPATVSPTVRGRGRGRGQGRGRGRGGGKGGAGKKQPAGAQPARSSALSRDGRESKCALLDHVLVAAALGTCLNQAINTHMGNKNSDPSYRCGACSSCCPDELPQPRPTPAADTAADATANPSATTLADATQVLEELGSAAASLWLESDLPRAYSSSVFLSRLWKERIVLGLSKLERSADIEGLMRDWTHWADFGPQLTTAVLAKRTLWLRFINTARKARLAKQRVAQARKRKRADDEDENELVGRAEREAQQEAEELGDESSGDERPAEIVTAGGQAGDASTVNTGPQTQPVAGKRAPRKRITWHPAVEKRVSTDTIITRKGRTARKVLYDETNV